MYVCMYVYIHVCIYYICIYIYIYILIYKHAPVLLLGDVVVSERRLSPVPRKLHRGALCKKINRLGLGVKG